MSTTTSKAKNKETKNQQNEASPVVKLSDYQELDNKYKRALADQQNLEKQHQKDRSHYIKYANEQLLLTILPIYNNLKLAYKHFNLDNPSSWLDGLKYIINQFKDILKQENVIEIETNNQPFNHHSMEAVEIIETDNKEQDNMVAEEIRPGYKLADRVIMPARVRVYHYKHQNGSMPLDHN
ncbi:MAG TPA: nucleotide exchange factor GrpE [bacterium]|nr:nucleotide exchange factor GrpE [bacterium]HPD03447.1 nucleotide exchange factor GrpE [bacterium]HPL83528.1 nucleotide exchange factor GrpE [bacterium]HQI10733.1 nucleotide exchange factor GrpE [bacterium]HRS73271.1 nucleotide exchange factor GrpE [Patescibacteria group bacterium]